MGQSAMPQMQMGMASQDQVERERFEKELQRIIKAGETSRIILRVLGSIGFQLHCPKYGYLQADTGRVYTDIDLASYSRYAKTLRELMVELGYQERRETFIISEGGHATFDHHDLGLHVDVFFNSLDFCHTIPWNGRLELEKVTIPLAEMLLAKLQIVNLRDKDVLEVIMLLLEHPLGESEEETINMQRVADLCSSDWGLWRTVTMNLEKVKARVQDIDQLTREQKERISEQVDQALRRMEEEPKSMAWRLRARVGDRIQWYRNVDEKM